MKIYTLLVSLASGAEPWIEKYVPTPIEYTVYNEVAIVHNTGLDFAEFYSECQDINKDSGDTFSKAVVRECLAKYLFPRIVVDPIKPSNENLYNAEYEHRKEVFGHKAAKDFIIRQNQD